MNNWPQGKGARAIKAAGLAAPIAQTVRGQEVAFFTRTALQNMHVINMNLHG